MFAKQSKLLPFVMWALPLLFFTYQFILRLWPGLMMQEIMEQFSINASQFGVMSALMYYGYSGMQIPVAILLDKFSARYIVFIFAVLCGVATLTFTYTDNWYIACFSRFLVGVGSAVGFLGTSKVISECFPKNQYAKMVGYSFSFGLMGAIFGGKPISMLIESYSWQKVALSLSVISVAIGTSAYLFLRSYKKDATEENIEQFKFANFRKLLSSQIIWLIALSNLLMVGSLEGFADVWGVSYLTKAYGLEKGMAAELISFIFVGMLFGGPLLALLSRKLGNYLVIILCGLGMGLLFLYLLSGVEYNSYLFGVIFFLVGIMCCYQVIIFAAGADFVSIELLGVTIAFLNCINMLGGSFFHTLIGHLMDVFWTGGIMTDDNLREYSIESYETALKVIPICSILGACIISFVGYKLSRVKNHE